MDCLVLLAGCGIGDGSCIEEAVGPLWMLISALRPEYSDILS